MTFTVDQAAIQRLIISPDGDTGRDLRRRAQNVESEARRIAPVDSNRLRSSIHVDGPHAGTSGLAYDVVAATNYAIFVHEGRGPGRMPPSSALAGWARRHGAAGAEFVIARAIAERGIEGRPFLVDALPAALR